MITSGALFGTIITFIVLLVLGILLWLLFKSVLFDEMFVVGIITSIVVTIGLYVGCMWPFESEYHFWQNVDGNIIQVERRMMGDGSGSMQEVFPVKLTGHNDVYRVDDSRAATFKTGDYVRLLCKRSYDFVGYDGWTCKIGEM